jgi:hypothetical protein
MLHFMGTSLILLLSLFIKPSFTFESTNDSTADTERNSFDIYIYICRQTLKYVYISLVLNYDGVEFFTRQVKYFFPLHRKRRKYSHWIDKCPKTHCARGSAWFKWLGTMTLMCKCSLRLNSLQTSADFFFRVFSWLFNEAVSIIYFVICR